MEDAEGTGRSWGQRPLKGRLRGLDPMLKIMGIPVDLEINWARMGLAGGSGDPGAVGGVRGLPELSLLLGGDPGKEEAKGLVESQEQSEETTRSVC